MMTREESQRIWQLIRHSEVAMLVTDRSPGLRARPMFTVQHRFDGTLWFITSESSAKVDEIADNQQVCLSFAREKDGVYVSLSGTAALVSDEALIEKFWNASAEHWFERGKGDPDAVLLEVHVERAEVWDARSNTMTRLNEPVAAGNYDQNCWASEYRHMSRH